MWIILVSISQQEIHIGVGNIRLTRITILWRYRLTFRLSEDPEHLACCAICDGLETGNSVNENNIALLIDVDNVSAKYVKSIFEELNAFGTVSIRRIYGNWKKTYGWNEDILLEYSIQPIQQFDYTKGKNATDMAMVIDAMDMLYSHNIDVFCIVTSDSDFTKLAMRLRESQAYEQMH